ncbi:PAS domain S-box protein [Bacillus salitolerans]|uniref:PAS domain S-box protein n=1 Tax=Bacillus salitolerans TaxID=1437434 RepID=A0ABW4LYJ5_9BACI
MSRKLESVQHYKSLYENHPDAIFTFDVSGNFLDVNPACEKLSGYSAEELIGRSYLPLIASNEREKVKSSFDRVLLGETESYECSIHDKSGRVIDLSIMNIPIVIDRKVTGVFGIAKDITEMKRLEKQLLNSQKELKDIVHKHLGFIFKFKKIKDEFIYTLADGQLLSKMGSSSGDVLHKTVEEVFGYSEETLQIKNIYERAWSGEEDLFYEGTFNGISYITRLTPIFRENEVTEVLGSSIDITELKNMERILSVNEKRFRSVVELSPSIIIIHRDQKILYANPAAVKIVGLNSQDELNDHFITDFIHTDSQELYETRMKSFMDDTDNSFREYRIIRNEGKDFYIEARAREIHYKGQTAVLTVGVDITARKEKEEQLRKSEQLLAEAQRIAKLGSWEFNLLEKKLCWSDETYRIFGVTSEEFTPSYDALLNFIPPEEREYVHRESEAALNQKLPFLVEHRIILADGKEKFVRQQAEVIYEDGQAIFMIGTIQDITKKRKTELELKRSEEKFRSMVQHASDVISIVDEKGVIQYQSPSSKQIFGHEPEELLGKNGFTYNHPDERGRAEEILKKALKHPGRPIRAELMIQHKSGKWLHCEQVSTNLLHDPNVSGIVVNIRDITKQKEYFEQVRQLAYHDDLTMLLNKRGLNQLLIEEIQASMKTDSCFSLLYLDLDNFKYVNDSLGHEVGDKLLQKISGMLRDLVGDKGKAARLGGDEFAIVLRNLVNIDDVEVMAGNIIQMFNQPFKVDQYQFYITTSIGISYFPNGAKDSDTLLKHADMAMYRAKHSGKNTYRIFDEDIQKSNERTFFIQNDLRNALINNELTVHYQPRISTDSEKMVGVEALVRWNHPKLGPISPIEFIPVAEESGWIVQLGEWVLDSACKQLVKWHQQGYTSLSVSVNFSPLQFLQIDLHERVKHIIDKYNVNPNQVEIEITESAVIDQDVGLQENISKLKEIGLQIAIDDFGTGYSSLMFIKKFQVDTIKIDRSFLFNLLDDIGNLKIVSAIINLAKALGLNVVAEGVETCEQLFRLKEMDCKEVQGYYFSKPLPSDELEKNVFPKYC